MFFPKFLYRNLKGNLFLIILTVMLTFIGVFTDILSAFPLKFILDKSINNADPQFPGASTILQFFRTIVPQQDGVLAFSVTMIFVFGLVSAGLSYFQLRSSVSIAKGLTLLLSNRLFNHLQCLPVSWHRKHEGGEGDLVERIMGSMEDLEKFVVDGLIDLLTSILTLVGIFAIMVATNPPFALISIIIASPLFLIVPWYTIRIKKSTNIQKKADSTVSSLAAEAMGKILEIKAFTLETFLAKNFQQRSRERFDAGMRAGSLQAQYTPLVTVTLVVGTTIIVAIGASAATAHKDITIASLLTIPARSVTFGTLTLFLTYLTKLFDPLKDLSKLTALTSKAASAATRIQQVLDQPTETFGDSPQQQQLKGTITYENVRFRYNRDDHKYVLNGINLNILAGKKIALVGLSGSGKTTLTNLLPRFYELRHRDGTVKIDGTDIHSYSLTTLRSNISVVLQDSILFDVSIKDNIRIGNLKGTDKEIEQAAEKAYIHDEIKNKLGGYDARISNHGKNLSGGQRQRIAIARAILRDAPIIIMDEPTAALDAEAEAEVMLALSGLVTGRTVIMITHRLSTVGRVDEIIALQNGQIVEQGSLDDLINKQGGIVRHLIQQQIGPLLAHYDPGKSIIRSSSMVPDPTSSKAEVLIQINGQIISSYQLDTFRKSVLTIGSQESNDIPIPSQFVSRHHAKLVWEHNAWVIKDAGSTNKLYFNGKVVEKHILSNEDKISIPQGISIQYKQKHSRPTPPPPDPFKAQVIVEVNGQNTHTYELNAHKTTFTIGRYNPSVHPQQYDIPIASRFISRSLHAQILRENKTWVIKPCQPTQLYYGGKQIDQHTFANGDRVYLAHEVVLHYQTLP